ncbi:MAG: 30S ribosomal protein S5 [Candidatus Pacearchaeota archaeon]
MKASRKKELLEREKKKLIREAEEEKLEEKIEEIVKEEELTPEKIREIEREKKLSAWKPKTELGRLVKEKKITNIDEILDKGKVILEPEIVDALLDYEFELINIGQSKGKFGGGKRRAWRQTQKKTAEGNVPKFSAMVVIGDKNGHLGVGMEKAKETVPAREKALRRAKLNIFKVVRGCGSFNCCCNEPHSIPFRVEGKCSGVRVILIPAPRGAGLVADDELKKVFRLAGIKDIYVKSFGKTRTKYNHIKAVVDALKKLY